MFHFGTYIYTHGISQQLQLDLAKHNHQYEPINIHTYKHSHDRFLIIDDNDVYHIGASLKDLGKRMFAFYTFQDHNRLVVIILN